MALLIFGWIIAVAVCIMLLVSVIYELIIAAITVIIRGTFYYAHDFVGLIIAASVELIALVVLVFFWFKLLPLLVAYLIAL